MVVFGKTAVTSNALFSKRMTFVSGVEGRIAVAFSEQKAQGSEGAQGHDQPKNRFFVHGVHLSV